MDKFKTVPESQILKLLYQRIANGRTCWGHQTKVWMTKWKILGSIVEHASLLECDAVSSHKQFLIYQRIRVPSQCWEVFMWCCVIAQAVPDISKDQSAFRVLGSVHVMLCHHTSSSRYIKGSECLHSVGKCSCDAVSSHKQCPMF